MDSLSIRNIEKPQVAFVFASFVITGQPVARKVIKWPRFSFSHKSPSGVFNACARYKSMGRIGQLISAEHILRSDILI